MAVLSDPISDFLTRLKNASLAGNEEFTAPCSNIKVEIARILQEEGYIWNYEVTGEGSKKQIKVKIKFTPQAGCYRCEAQLQAGPPPVRFFRGHSPRSQRAWHCHRLHLPRCDDRCAGAQAEHRRRTSRPCMVTINIS